MPESTHGRTLSLTLTVNDQSWTGEVRPEETLLAFLRERLGLKGTKRSCESQVCGACTVLVNNLPVSSCAYLVWEARGKRVVTIEGLSDGERLDPIQEAFVNCGAIQCGYCTPGMVMMVKGLLAENPSPSREEIREWLKGSICRCGGYNGIEKAILSVTEMR